MYTNHSTVLAIGDRDYIKRSLLYFDSVIPITLPDTMLNFWPPNSDELAPFINHLLDVQRKWLVENEKEYMEPPTEENKYFDGEESESYKLYEKQSDQVQIRFLNALRKKESDLYRDLMSAYKISEVASLSRKIPLVLQSERELSNSSLLDISVTLTGIPVIDVSNVSQSQIFEFKQDQERKATIRKFRMALVKNYENKSRDYIFDHLSTVIEDYKLACSYHGFTTKSGILKNVLSSKNILASSTVALSSVLLGEPLGVILSLASGASVEFGKLTLEISKNRAEFEYNKSQNDFVYILDVVDKLII